MRGRRGEAIIALAAAAACAAAGPVDRAGTLGIAYFGPLAPTNALWYAKCAADFNADGHPDTVGIEAWGHRIAVVLSSPEGYDPAILLELCDCFGNDEPSMATGDVDGDGRPEVLVADPTGRRVWAVPVVDGAFGQGWWISTGDVASVRFAFETMPDLDGDGRAELVFASAGVLAVLPSTKPGVAFERATAVSWYTALADLTGDGVPDAMVAADGSVRVFPGGSQGFGAAIDVSVSAGVVSVVDLDGDGAADLIASDASAGEGWIRRNEGDGSFGTERRFPAEAPFDSLVSVGDLDESGLPDVVALVRPPGHSLFSRHVWQDPWTGDGLEEAGSVEVPDRGRFSSRDLDGDGRRDVVSVSAASATGFLIRHKSQPIAGTRSIELSFDPLDVRAADMDSDGTPELIVSHFTGVSVFERQASGSYAESVLSSGTGARFMSVPADMDGDGAKDLVVSAMGEGIEIWPGSSDGLGAPPVPYSFDSPSLIWQLQVGDVTGDGVSDVVAADADAGVVHVLIGQDSGFPVVRHSIPTPNARAVAVMDLDGDGVSEVVASGDMVIQGFRWSIDGWETIANVTTDVSAYWLTAADLDADGWDDLIVANSETAFADLYVLYGGPSGLSVPMLVQRTRRGHAEIMARDVNGDGMTDLVVAPMAFSGDDGMAHVLLQAGSRTFVDGGHLPGRAVGGIDAADLDNDGILDIVGVCQDGSTDLIQIHANRSLSCPADLTGDGDLDFFDISGFLSLYNAQDPAADLAEPFGGFNFFDVSAYLAVYNAGCP